MCGRYTLTTPDPAAIRDRFPVGEAVEVHQRFNVAPGDDVLAVTTDRAGEPRGELLRWGLVPSWSKTGAQGSDGLKMINARLETARERPAFRRSFERFRCLIVADGFYEWRRSGTGPKQPFHITRDGGGLFSCTILTTAANAAIASLHDRMPVILDPEHERDWLNTSTPPSRLSEILAGLPAAHTQLQAVSLAVNDARYDGPECLAPPPAEAQEALF